MPTRTFDYLAILETLARHEVDFIVVGTVCAVLQGAPLMTLDLDIVHSRSAENLDRLVTALQELDAHYREQPERHLAPTTSHLASDGHQLLITRLGPLDILGTLGQGQGYEELLPHTVERSVDLNLKVRILNLSTLIAVKEQAGREKDRAVLPTLRRTLEELDRVYRAGGLRQMEGGGDSAAVIDG